MRKFKIRRQKKKRTIESGILSLRDNAGSWWKRPGFWKIGGSGRRFGKQVNPQAPEFRQRTQSPANRDGKSRPWRYRRAEIWILSRRIESDGVSYRRHWRKKCTGERFGMETIASIYSEKWEKWKSDVGLWVKVWKKSVGWWRRGAWSVVIAINS